MKYETWKKMTAEQKEDKAQDTAREDRRGQKGDLELEVILR